MESGYIKPSKGKLNNHGAKSFTSNEAGELVLCDTLKFTVMPKNRAKVKQYIQERRFINKILKQKELEEKKLEKNSDKYSIFTSIKKWAKDKSVALSMNKAWINHIVLNLMKISNYMSRMCYQKQRH